MLYTFDMEDEAGNEAMESFLADYTENQNPLYDYESRTTYAAEFESFGSMLLLLGYCVGAGLWDRFKKVMKFSMLFSFGLSAVMTGVCYLFNHQIVSAFLTDPDAFDYAVQFARILLTTSFLFGVFYVLSNSLQAMGAATEALIINLSRQGIIYIPALFIMNAAIGITGLVWAQPVADLLSTAMVLVLYFRTVNKMQQRSIEKVDRKQGGN